MRPQSVTTHPFCRGNHDPTEPEGFGQRRSIQTAGPAPRQEQLDEHLNVFAATRAYGEYRQPQAALEHCVSSVLSAAQQPDGMDENQIIQLMNELEQHSQAMLQLFDRMADERSAR
ncbi:hypothetical protein [Pseudogulbenkiania subflava]|uniref:Uncharacterized protein n=1 Tax=Pseudogulbenkiania subflava DSM 22618 TaxID=1123014 RepID=A0A1Y6C977_9NEIS|nr:hypothetical protein [Pseudogulbenkiania subflava]SMF51358.1 hypothetical protein SAMN02745746_03685 [Pseudogulbenkiania subflava DSM 22618]